MDREGSISPDHAEAHVRSIAAKKAITIEWTAADRADEAWAVREMDLVSIPRIRSLGDYAIALHELGHVLGPRQTSEVVSVRERWAWRWAEAHALVWTEEMERQRQRSIRSARTGPRNFPIAVPGAVRAIQGKKGG